MKKPLRNELGQPLLFFTILVGNSTGPFQLITDVVNTVGYTKDEVLAEAQSFYKLTNTSSTMEPAFEIKKSIPVTDLIRVLREGIDDDVFAQKISILIKQPKFKSTEAASFLQNLIEAAPALEENETERYVLIKSLTKIKNLYGHPAISRPRAD